MPTLRRLALRGGEGWAEDTVPSVARGMVRPPVSRPWLLRLFVCSVRTLPERSLSAASPMTCLLRSGLFGSLGLWSSGGCVATDQKEDHPRQPTGPSDVSELTQLIRYHLVLAEDTGAAADDKLAELVRNIRNCPQVRFGERRTGCLVTVAAPGSAQTHWS